MSSPRSMEALTCPTCSKPFGRLEHLKRHILIHTKERVYNCPICTKQFTRSDALKRHQATHNNEPSLLQTRSRACGPCALAKDKCSGDLPCSRCRRRNLNCSYPDGCRQDHGTTVDVTSVLDVDFWNPNILSTSNWLGDIDDAGFSLDFFDTPYAPSYDADRINLPTITPLSATSTRGTDQLVSDRSVFSISAGSTIGFNEGETPSTDRGSFYVDGEPARLPRTKRRRISTHVQEYPRQVPGTFSLSCSENIGSEIQEGVKITTAAYEQLGVMHQTLCVKPGVSWKAYQCGGFPSKRSLECMVDLYFRQFDQTLPFIHSSTMTEPMEDITIILAMAAIGCRYIEPPENNCLALSMVEFSRRVLHLADETFELDSLSQHNIHQAQLLTAISMAYSEDGRLTRKALSNQRVLTAVFNFASDQYTQSLTSLLPTGNDQPQTQWHRWITLESSLRLAHSAWLIDSMWSYHFHVTPALSLHDAHLPIPSPESHWQATSTDSWLECPSPSVPIPSLEQSVQQLYMDKLLPSSRGQFSRILTIHALFQHTREIAQYHSNPLTTWTPTAKRQVSAEILPKGKQIWLPSNPVFARWQNSACDALDVMHWQANAAIGRAAGLEGAEVLHLHTARIVLLAPHREIVAFAKKLCDDKGEAEDGNGDEEIIRRWATQHRFKARLAVIHAGVTFWHVRQYSVEGFHEAHAVALAALTLWAYGMFAGSGWGSGTASAATRGNVRRKATRMRRSRRTQSSREGTIESSSRDEGGGEDGEANGEEEDEDDREANSIILLDHPTDDELVQLFIRDGARMRTHITGVGDLLGPRGPLKVLIQGRKILSSLKCWGSSVVWNEMLGRLIERCERDERGSVQR